MTDSARLPARRPMVVDGEVVHDDRITEDDIRRAEIGRRMKAEYPGAVTDPAKVAEIRRDMAYRARPWWRRLQAVIFGAADMATGFALFPVVFLAVAKASQLGVV